MFPWSVTVRDSIFCSVKTHLIFRTLPTAFSVEHLIPLLISRVRKEKRKTNIRFTTSFVHPNLHRLSGSPFIAQLRCDSLPTCRYYSVFGNGPQDASLCDGNTGLHGFYIMDSLTLLPSDVSWSAPYSKKNAVIGIKKSESGLQ